MTDYHRFCNVCEFKEWNTQRGILCGKTNSKPQFKDTCKDYIYSKIKFKELVESKIKFYEKILSRDMVTSVQTLKVKPTKFKENHRFNNTQRMPEDYNVYYPFPIKLVYGKPILEINNKGIKWRKICLDLISLLRGEIIKIKELGWNEIVYTSYQIEYASREHNKDFRSEKLVIESVSKESTMSIPIFFDKRKSEIAHYIELFKQKNNIG